MRKWMLLVVPMVVVLAAGAAVYATTPGKSPAATPAAAAFTIQGKILKMEEGRFQVEVSRVQQGAGLKVGDKIWIRETIKTKILQAGKAASVKALKVGAQVEVYGTIVKSGKTSTYDALTVQLGVSH